VSRSTLLLAGVWLLVVAGVPARVRAAAVIRVNDLDHPGEGFNDPTPVAPIGGNPGVTLGEQRLIAFRYAANIWGALLDSAVDIRVGAHFDPLMCDASNAILGQAGPVTIHRDFAGAPLGATWYPVALANALAGRDLSPGKREIQAQFSSSYGVSCPFPRSWYYGLDAQPGAAQTDFVTVVLHELAHGLGFLTFYNVKTGQTLMGRQDAFMRWLEDATTGRLFPDLTPGERVAASVSTDKLQWGGPLVTAAATEKTAGVGVGGHVEMYAPPILEPGSSVVHYSEAVTPDELMEPFYTGPDRDLRLTVALLADVGWAACTTCPTPVPCVTVEACRAPFAAALPDPGTATDDASRATATRITTLAARVETALDRAAVRSGGAQRRQYARASRALRALLAAAREADASGTLGVPLGPLAIAGDTLLALLSR